MIRRWKCRKQAREFYTDGYDWAAGAILRGDLTEEQVDTYIYPGNGPFDQGAVDAMRRLTEIGVLADEDV